MGLFSKKKQDKGAPMPNQEPPMPPSLSDVGHPPVPSDSGAPPMPKAPESSELKAPPIESAQDVNEPQAPAIPDLPELNSKMSAPPLPGGNGSPLDEIKSEVSPGLPTEPQEEPSTKMELPQLEGSDDNDLFDMFDVGGSSDLEPENAISEENDAFDMEDLAPSTKRVQRTESLNFSKSGMGGDSKFLTTSQFKSMLEIIEQVKNKVKGSNEVHLRMLDMKSEEDIEYESLRKSFQFLEDKLYELDEIIFEK